MDQDSLHSCLLVNKEWCNIAVPILWKKFSVYFVDNETEKKILNTILSCLPSSSKQLLFDNEIKLPSTILLKPPLFNYVSLYRFPDDTNKFMKIIEIDTTKPESCNLFEQEIYKLFVNHCNNIRVLQWKTSQPLPLFPGASTCFSQLQYLSIDTEFVDSNTMYEMAQICKDLHSLTIRNCCQDLLGLISLIDAQRNLKNVFIYADGNKEGTCKELGKALARKGNTIEHLYLGINIARIIPPSFLPSLTNLKELEIGYGETYDLRQYLANSEFPNLNHLYAYGLLCFKEFTTIIEKTNGSISSVGIYTESYKYVQGTGKLVKAIANKCPNIRTLHTLIEPKDFIHIRLLLLNCKCLECIVLDSLDFHVSGNDNIGDELLDILTKFSPNSLTEIQISSGWKYSTEAFERFFESCRERTLQCFGTTSYRNSYITRDHEEVFNKYVREGVVVNSDDYSQFDFLLLEYL